jgi:hypothetical protein
MTKTSKLAGGLTCTYGARTTYQDNEVVSLQVLLPNGRNVELFSEQGADEFIDTVGADFISTSLTATDDTELTCAYTLMIAVSDNASPEKIASGIPESELGTFIEKTRDTLDTLSSDRDWLRSGTVSKWHDLLLQTIASFSKHSSFLKMFLSNEGMEAVAKFYASRKMNDTPSHKVAEFIVLLVNNSLSVLEHEGVSGDKAFGIIEKTGLLGQFIRCVPVVDPERSASQMTWLQTCSQLVKKKLKAGTRTGDILDAVIAGKDGPINEEVKSSLVKLQSLARLSNNNSTDDQKCMYLKMCQHCDKTETQMDSALLMKCQRCKVTYYCSKDCQVADWKIHKKLCEKFSSGVVSRSAIKTSQTTISSFVESNYFGIAREVYKKTQEYSVPKKELLVEIDFYKDAPALRNKIQVFLLSDFFEGSALVDAPEWFRTDANKKSIARCLREIYERVTSDDLLSVCCASNGIVTVQLLRFPGADAGSQLLSDEAVESIGREDYVRMVACLGEHTTNDYFGVKRAGL